MPPTDRPKRRPDPIRALRVAIAASVVIYVVGTGLSVYQSAQARQENCDNVIAAFDAYTDALAKVSGADESKVAEFRAAYEPALKDCH